MDFVIPASQGFILPVILLVELANRVPGRVGLANRVSGWWDCRTESMVGVAKWVLGRYDWQNESLGSMTGKMNPWEVGVTKSTLGWVGLAS